MVVWSCFFFLGFRSWDGNGMVWFGDGRHRLVVGGGYLWLFGPIARFPFWGVANAYGGVI